jgi:hypothetical protein
MLGRGERISASGVTAEPVCAGIVSSIIADSGRVDGQREVPSLPNGVWKRRIQAGNAWP